MAKLVVDTDVLADKLQQLRESMKKQGYATVVVDVMNKTMEMVIESAAAELTGHRRLLPEDEASAKLIKTLLGHDEPPPTVVVLEHLTRATDILLHHKDYDGDGWETLQHAMNHGVKLIANIQAARIEFAQVSGLDPDLDYCNCHPDTGGESTDDPAICAGCHAPYRKKE